MIVGVRGAKIQHDLFPIIPEVQLDEIAVHPIVAIRFRMHHGQGESKMHVGRNFGFGDRQNVTNGQFGSPSY